jgi:hypothetical protein
MKKGGIDKNVKERKQEKKETNTQRNKDVTPKTVCSGHFTG